MKYLIVIAALIARISHAQSVEEMRASCAVVTALANQAYHISHSLGLAEDRWIVSEEGYDPATYQMIQAIKHEAYHDTAALRRRVEAACATSS